MRRWLIVLTLLWGLVFAPVLSPVRPVSAATSPDAAAQKALTWMREQQLSNGGFPGGVGATVDALLAFASAGVDPSNLSRGGSTPLVYLASQADAFSKRDAASAAKLILGVLAANGNPRNLGGIDLVARLDSFYIATYGQYGTTALDQSLALLALRGLGRTIPANAIATLIALQLPDGGWEFSQGQGSDTNTTALALQAMAKQPGTSAAIAKALAYLQTQQNNDGGFPYQKPSSFSTETDANSTAYVIQALIAVGESPQLAANWNKGSNTPLSALLALQNANGAFRYQAAIADDSPLATYQAVPGVLGRVQPILQLRIYVPVISK